MVQVGHIPAAGERTEEQKNSSLKVSKLPFVHELD